MSSDDYFQSDIFQNESRHQPKVSLIKRQKKKCSFFQWIFTKSSAKRDVILGLRCHWFKGIPSDKWRGISQENLGLSRPRDRLYYSIYKYGFSVYEAPDGQFGRLNKGRWNGMIGERADMAMASFTPSAERMEFVDFTSPFVEGYLAIFYKMTKPVPNNRYRKHSLFFFWPKNNLCTKTSTKVNLVTLYIFTSFVISCYTSVLVSFMTVTSSELPFTNIDELINNPNYGVAFVAGTIEPESAKASSSLSEGVWANIMSNPNNFVQTYKEGVIKACDEPIGFVTFSHLISPLPDISSNTILDKEVKSTDAMCSVISEYDKYNKHVKAKVKAAYNKDNDSSDIVLMELKESGVLTRILNKYLKESDLNQDTDKSGIVQVVGIIHSWLLGVNSIGSSNRQVQENLALRASEKGELGSPRSTRFRPMEHGLRPKIKTRFEHLPSYLFNTFQCRPK
ncbi:Glutamate receptor ionotropic, delta-1 [Nymphon striatum]|nr:Glutamate receptor ionotropic, delta-1 [Nymphon striatum]